MWSSSGDSIGHLLDQEVTERLTKKLLELFVERADTPHVVPFGGRHVGSHIGPDMLEVPGVFEDRVLRLRILPDPRLQQVKRKLRVDHLLGSELRQDGREDRLPPPL